MTNVIQPSRLLVIALAGWLNRHQQAVIDYLIEENRVLKDQLKDRRRRFIEEQLDTTGCESQSSWSQIA